ncbi:MAG: hypothetical protein ACRDQU_10905 [Pseudonocardiaceae bacterium]
MAHHRLWRLPRAGFPDLGRQPRALRTVHRPRPPRHTGTATDPDQRWTQLARLLHDDSLDTLDRVTGCLLLLLGQQQSRIATMTTDRVIHRDGEVFIRSGRHELPIPEPLQALLLELINHRKPYVGIGSPTSSPWLFPGLLPGRPITASRLADRLRTLGIPTQAARRAALIDLATQLPAAVLANLVNLHPTTAVKWTHQAGGDWTRYAAELARTRNHIPPSRIMITMTYSHGRTIALYQLRRRCSAALHP